MYEYQYIVWISGEFGYEYAVSVNTSCGYALSVDTRQIEVYTEANYHMETYEEAAASDGNAVRSQRKLNINLEEQRDVNADVGI